jgi:hypothetical protein
MSTGMMINYFIFLGGQGFADKTAAGFRERLQFVRPGRRPT